jgi:anti-anti-sigma factor
LSRVVRKAWFEAEQVDGVTVVTFTAKDLSGADDIEAVGQELFKLLEYFSSPRLVLNLGSVHRLSSLMLGKLLALNARVRTAGGRMVLCRVSANVQGVFKAVNLLQTFPIYGEEHEAVRSF